MADGAAGDDPAAEVTVDQARVRGLVIDANDGIIAVAGIGEGLVGAGASATAVVVAVVAAAIAGSIALSGAKFAEAANERDAQQALIDEEARQLALSPEEELAELTAIYEAKGLSAELAEQVAAELSRDNALAAHAEAEHGIDLGGPTIRPVVIAVSAGLAFITGALSVIATIVFTPDEWRTIAVLVTAAVSLCVTSAIAGRWGHVPMARTAVRSVAVGLSALLLSLAVGSLFDL